MDWVSLISAIGVSSVLTTVVTGVLNKRINRATANNSNADYAEKIIKQSDERVAQVLADYNRAMKERDDAFAESKNQRKAKHDWREKAMSAQTTMHEQQLRIKDLESTVKLLEYHKCEIFACSKRVPPRRDDESSASVSV